MSGFKIDKETAKRLKKEYKELNLSNDFLFSLVMQDEESCKALLEEILEIKIDRIVYNEEQKSVKSKYEGKGVRFDAYVKDGQGTVYSVVFESFQKQPHLKSFAF